MAKEYFAAGSSSAHRKARNQESSWASEELCSLCDRCELGHHCTMREPIPYHKVEKDLLYRLDMIASKTEYYYTVGFERLFEGATYPLRFYAKLLVHHERVVREIAKKEGVDGDMVLLEGTDEFVAKTLDLFVKLDERIEACRQNGTLQIGMLSLKADAKRALLSIRTNCILCMELLDELCDALAAKYAR